jgi:hypothetical protein
MTIEDQRPYRANRSRMDQKELPQGSPDKALISPIPDGYSGSRKEIDGPRGLEPTRYGDWEKNGRCIDF